MPRQFGKQELNTDINGKSLVLLPAVPMPTSGDLGIQVDYTNLGGSQVTLAVEHRIGARWLTADSATIEPTHDSHGFNLFRLNTREVRVVVKNPQQVAGTIETIHFLLA